jgi:lipoate-protein ligase A
VLFAELLEVLDPDPHDAALNMAIDEALLRLAEQPTLRVYRWREPAVSFGYFGRIAEVERIAAGRRMVRRWTGGGIVEHGDDLTYTLLIPREHDFFRHSAPESYRLIHEVIAQSIASAGTAADLAPETSAEHSSACFARPVQYDLVSEGVKIAGAAQRRTRWGLMHQGSIQLRQAINGLGGKLADIFGSKVCRCGLAPAVQEAGRTLAQEKYGTSSWLRRF